MGTFDLWKFEVWSLKFLIKVGAKNPSNIPINLS